MLDLEVLALLYYFLDMGSLVSCKSYGGIWFFVACRQACATACSNSLLCTFWISSQGHAS